MVYSKTQRWIWQIFIEESLSDAADFYIEIVGDKHLADLAAWHISSKDYIADIKLQQRFSRNLVLDFGGGMALML